MFAVLFAGIAMTVGEGLWSNTVAFLGIWLSSMLGLFFGPSVGLIIQEQLDKEVDFTWYFIFVGMWAVFAVAVLVIRVMFDRISRIRVRFIPQLEAVGGPLMGILVAVVFTSFCTVTLFRGPINAGAWKKSDASGWVESSFQYMLTPMMSIANAWDEGDRLSDLKK
ncbi:MAG: hypothetical protein CMJ58_08815 [Planctomycetaceae bacterium]|nr:hypothetical protein [Planctomycetaceae bacterium]